MKKRAFKLLICICVISCLMVGFCTSFSSAATPVWLLRAKAGVAAAMLASQLVLQPIDVFLDAPIAQAVDPLGRNDWVETLPEYLDRSTIKIVEDTVVIDGVSYSDVWLGPDAAQSLRLQGLDFATAYNIASNQTDAISYASGAGYSGDVPFYNYDGAIRTPEYSVSGPGSYDIGLFDVTYTSTSSSGGNGIALNPNGTYSSQWSYGNYQLPALFRNTITSNGSQFNVSLARKNATSSSYSWVTGSTEIPVQFDNTPFSFDYTSGVIDAPVSQEDGLLVRVPTSYSDPQSGSVVYDIHDFTVNFPDISQPGGHEVNIDPDLNPDFQTDIDLGNGIGDLLLTIFGLDLLNKIINFAPEPATPEPGPQPGVIDPLPDPDPAPDDPTPGTTIADTDWTKLDEILRWIQSTIDSIRHLTESLQTMLDSIFDAIQSAIQHIAEISEAIRELADKILEDIELGPSKVFRKALDILKSLFLPLLLPIKAMMGLWHYVVEWVQSISSPFSWIFGFMAGTSYNMVLPIYAVLAGSICIAIYKVLGR